MPPVRQCAGRPRRRPAKLHADKGYDFAHCRRGVESSERLGRHRWVVERTLAWLARFRRLAVRYERRADIFTAFHHIAASLICWRFVQRCFCQALLHALPHLDGNSIPEPPLGLVQTVRKVSADRRVVVGHPLVRGVSRYRGCLDYNLGILKYHTCLPKYTCQNDLR